MIAYSALSESSSFSTNSYSVCSICAVVGHGRSFANKQNKSYVLGRNYSECRAVWHKYFYPVCSHRLVNWWYSLPSKAEANNFNRNMHLISGHPRDVPLAPIVRCSLVIESHLLRSSRCMSRCLNCTVTSTRSHIVSFSWALECGQPSRLSIYLEHSVDQRGIPNPRRVRCSWLSSLYEPGFAQVVLLSGSWKSSQMKQFVLHEVQCLTQWAWFFVVTAHMVALCLLRSLPRYDRLLVLL